MTMRQGTIDDATLIAAPSSTKNKEGKLDPEMHQTKKGNKWSHRYKDSGLIHSFVVTALQPTCMTSPRQLSCCMLMRRWLTAMLAQRAGSAVELVSCASPIAYERLTKAWCA